MLSYHWGARTAQHTAHINLGLLNLIILYIEFPCDTQHYTFRVVATCYCIINIHY